MIQPGGPYLKMPWEKVHRIRIATSTVNMALDLEDSTANEAGTRLEAVTKDQLNTGLTGQIRYRVSEKNLYAFLFGIKKPIVHVMAYFVSVLRQRIANFEAKPLSVPVEAGAPDGVIQVVDEPSVPLIDALMTDERTSVIVATGGVPVVRAAYSSGTPAIGVGPGNVPVFIERSADVPKAVQDILTGKCFDNGTICASEQAIVVDAPIEMAVREQFKLQGGYFISQSEADQLARIVATPQRSLNPGIVGRSVEKIAGMAGINVAFHSHESR